MSTTDKRPGLDRRSLPRTGRTELLGVRLKPETIELAKQLAVQQQRTIGDIVERSIENYARISDMSEDEQRPRRPKPRSKKGESPQPIIPRRIVKFGLSPSERTSLDVADPSGKRQRDK